MTTICPVCHEKMANRSIQAHITKKIQKGDEAHKAYRNEQNPEDEVSIWAKLFGRKPASKLSMHQQEVEKMNAEIEQVRREVLKTKMDEQAEIRKMKDGIQAIKTNQAEAIIGLQNALTESTAKASNNKVRHSIGADVVTAEIMNNPAPFLTEGKFDHRKIYAEYAREGFGSKRSHDLAFIMNEHLDYDEEPDEERLKKQSPSHPIAGEYDQIMGDAKLVKKPKPRTAPHLGPLLSTTESKHQQFDGERPLIGLINLFDIAHKEKWSDTDWNQTKEMGIKHVKEFYREQDKLTESINDPEFQKWKEDERQKKITEIDRQLAHDRVVDRQLKKVD